MSPHFWDRVSESRVRSLTEALERLHGVCAVAVCPHPGTRLLCIRMSVNAHDLAEAADRAISLARGCASYPGLGNLVLVAAREAGPVVS